MAPAASTPLDLDRLVPWVVGLGLLLTRLHVYRTLKHFVVPSLAALLIYRGLYESDQVTLLEYIVNNIYKHCRNTTLRFMVLDTIGVVLLAGLVQFLTRKITFDLMQIKVDLGNWGFNLVKALPPVANKIEKEKKDMESSLEATLKSKCKVGEPNIVLPLEGLAPTEIVRMMGRLSRKEEKTWGEGKCSGSVYLGDKEHLEFLNKVFGMYSVANPLHPAIWPSLMKFEAEIIAMVASMMNGGDKSVVGCVTSGGTESIVLAIKTHRDYHRDVHGITEPEMVACVSAHAAVNKGCELLGVKLVRVPMNPETFEVDLGALERAIGPNTIMMYSSAPSFPHGAIDPISKMSDIAGKYGIGLHVDCCLGGFILPFARKLGYSVPEFDFSLHGVTSMSVDTHKYGYALKGSSVVLYRDANLRRSQYFCYADWTGGMYATPTLAGSKSGGMVAQTWASMMSIGEEGYMSYADDIMRTARAIADGVSEIPHLKLMGRTPAMLVSFTGVDGLSIYEVNDRLTEKGWHLNSTQNPPAMNICCTVKTVGMEKELLRDLRESVNEVLAHPSVSGGTAKMYGTASAMPVGPVNEMTKVYLDVVYKTA